MGIDANRVYHLAHTVATCGAGGALCTLGVPTLHGEGPDYDRALTAAGFGGTGDLYERLGFTRVESLDVSDFEGCTRIFDLNTPGVPPELLGQFDVVYNGGTLEHVFDTRTALRNLFGLLKLGGVVIHAGPANGWLEHGFYQFSPTLFIDYYFANRFDILEAQLMQAVADRPGALIVHPYTPGAFDCWPASKAPGRWNFYMTFRKTAASTWDRIPQQRYYTSIYGDPDSVAIAPRLRGGAAYWMENGVPVPAASVAPVEDLLQRKRL